MQLRTTAAMCGAVFLALGRSAAEAQVRSGTGGAGLPQVPAPRHGGDTLFLVQGDHIRLTFARSREGGIGIATTGSRRTDVLWVSRSMRVATVTNTGYLSASRPGTTTILATARGGGLDSMVVHVMTPRESTNRSAAAACPNEDDSLFTIAGADSVLPLTRGISDIHEYHDCQRLIENGRYGPLVGIFAHRNVARFEAWTGFHGGILAATIVDFVGDKTPLPYDSLGIVPGTNCLILKADDQFTWAAAIISLPVVVDSLGHRHYRACSDTYSWNDVPPTARELEVKRQRNGVDYRGRPIAPPVARWDWDPRAKLNYIGIKCTQKVWCEIGWPGFDTSVAIRDRVTGRGIIKGYYDQQFLANADGSAPSSVFGTIEPGAHMKDTSQMHHGDKQWYHVANLTFHDTVGASSPDYVHYVRDY